MTPLIAQGTGMVQGGWEFVWAGYGLTWLMLGGYAISLFLRSSSDGEKS